MSLRYVDPRRGRRRWLAEESKQGLSKSHLKRLVLFMAAVIAIFLLFLVAVQVALGLVGKLPDPTFYDFYPIMVALGAAFGFERWWAYEQGEHNPFHER